MSALTPFPAILTVMLLSLVTTGCGCDREGIDARVDGEITVDQTTVPLDLQGQVTRSNVVEAFDRIRSVVDRGTSASSGFVFTVSGAGSTDEGRTVLAMSLPTPLREGMRIPVAGAFRGGGWGITAFGQGAWVSWERDGDPAIEADGGVEVLAIGPLVLEMDIELETETGSRAAVRGTVVFEPFREDVSCY